MIGPYQPAGGLDIGRLRSRAAEFAQRLGEVKQAHRSDNFTWYPYDTLGNLVHLDALLKPGHRDLGELLAGGATLDIGGADGDLAFLLEDRGVEVDVLDHAPTNNNGLQGIRTLKEALHSKVGIYDIDLDSQFELPRKRYGLVFFLGIFYHLKNPFYVLEALSKVSRYCLLSTRIAKFTPDGKARLQAYPVAYLVDERECNNDATNFWMFSEGGLKRIAQRAGWKVHEFMTAGDTRRSTPADMKHDERAFCLLESLRNPAQAP